MEQFKGDKLKALLLIFFTKYTRESNSKTLAIFEKEMGFYAGNPSTRELLDYLIKRKALIQGKVSRSRVFYFVNRKEVANVIDKQNILILHNKYLKETALLWI